MIECGTPALHVAGKCECAGIFWTDTLAAEQAEYDRQSVHGGAFHQCDCAPRCYHPQLSHAACPAGHPVHLDVDHYAEPTWVHCLIRDVVVCPHDYESLIPAADGELPIEAKARQAVEAGKHRATR